MNIFLFLLFILVSIFYLFSIISDVKKYNEIKAEYDRQVSETQVMIWAMQREIKELKEKVDG